MEHSAALSRPGKFGFSSSPYDWHVRLKLQAVNAQTPTENELTEFTIVIKCYQNYCKIMQRSRLANYANTLKPLEQAVSASQGDIFI
jgi:hypothetical protein